MRIDRHKRIIWFHSSPNPKWRLAHSIIRSQAIAVSSVSNLVHHRGINAVEHSRKNLPAGLHDDTEDGCRDREAHDRIGQRVAEPDAERTSEHGEARPSIDARM